MFIYFKKMIEPFANHLLIGSFGLRLDFLLKKYPYIVFLLSNDEFIKKNEMSRKIS